MIRKSAALGLAALAVATAMGLAPLPEAVPQAATVSSDAAQNATDAAKTKLFVKYATTSTCTVYLNYPKSGVVANSTFTIPAGKNVIWRYNVNKTWALISYPARAHKQFPWWGFTKRDCIGKSVQQDGYPAGRPIPNRILEGRSRVTASGWRSVTFNLPAAPIVARHKKVTKNATLRDDVNFVIGNVPAEWHVNVTDKTRSNGHWVEVYVPNAKRWGYIERSKLG